MVITPVEAGHKIQIPVAWAEELGLEHVATLEKTPGGILVRPFDGNGETGATWDEIYSDKLPLGPQPAAWDLAEVSGDDLLL